MGLYDGILIKDNHLAARGESSCAAAVADARRYMERFDRKAKIEIEVDSLEQLRDALNATPEIVLLDNMSPALMREAVEIRDATSPSTLLEASEESRWKPFERSRNRSRSDQRRQSDAFIARSRSRVRLPW